MKKFPIYCLLTASIFLSCCNSNDKKIGVLLFDSKHYKAKSAIQKAAYLDSALAAKKNYENNKQTRTFLFDVSAEYYYLQNVKKSLEAATLLLDLSKEQNDSLDIAKSFYYIGDCYETEKKDSAYFYYQKAERIYSVLKNSDLEAKMLFNKSYILFLEGSYLECEIMLSKALVLLKKSNDAELFYSITNLMGCNFEKLEDYDNALKYCNISTQYLEVLQSSDKDFDKINNYTIASTVNIAGIYEKKHEYKRAIAELEPIFINDLKTKWPANYATVVGNLGYCKMKLGELSIAEKLLVESYKISVNVGNQDDVSYKLKSLGEFYLLKKDTIKAVSYLKQSLKLAENLKSVDQMKAVLTLIATADTKNALKYNQKYIKISDSIYKIQKKTRDKYARIAYETAKIENENKILVQKNLVILIIALLVIVTLLLLLMVRYLKSKKVQIEYLLNQQEANEELFALIKNYENQIVQAKSQEQNRISRELHDSVMNKIYGVRLHLGMLNESDDPEVKQKRISYIHVLQDIEGEVRNISHELNNDETEKNFDFKDVLLKMIDQQNDLKKTRFFVQVDNVVDWEELSGLKKINLYRILQELILNVNKHARARTCLVNISLIEGNTILLKVKDNGVGFVQQKRNSSIGLKNIEKRADIIKGTLKISSNKNDGTITEVTIPLAD